MLFIHLMPRYFCHQILGTRAHGAQVVLFAHSSPNFEGNRHDRSLQNHMTPQFVSTLPPESVNMIIYHPCCAIFILRNIKMCLRFYHSQH